MKKNSLLFAIALLAIVASVNVAFAQEEAPPPPPPEEGTAEVPWLEDHAAAQKKAKEAGKLLVVDLYTDWCGWCKKLEQDTYPAPEVQAVLKKFVPLKINPEKVPFGRELMKKSGAGGFPATVITDADWNVIALISGFKAAEPYAQALEEALTEWDKYQTMLINVRGEADYAKIYEFLEVARKLRRKKEVREFGDKALDMEGGDKNAQIAFFIAKTYDVGSDDYNKYKEVVLKFDPENQTGHFDDFVLDDAIHTANSAKTPEERAAGLEAAKKILHDRLAQEKPALNQEKGQIMYWVLFQMYFQRGKGDIAKAKEMLKKGAEMNPESDMGKQMKNIIAKLGG